MSDAMMSATRGRADAELMPRATMRERETPHPYYYHYYLRRLRAPPFHACLFILRHAAIYFTPPRAATRRLPTPPSHATPR